MRSHRSEFSQHLSRSDNTSCKIEETRPYLYKRDEIKGSLGKLNEIIHVKKKKRETRPVDLGCG